MLGRFGDNGELWFEVELVAATGERFAVNALLDTGFTTGFLAINQQDLEALQWRKTAPDVKMQTARSRVSTGGKELKIKSYRTILGRDLLLLNSNPQLTPVV